jgi:hypothetical protein
MAQEDPPPPRPAVPGSDPGAGSAPGAGNAGGAENVGGSDADWPGPGGLAEPIPTSVRYRVDGRLVGLKATGLVIFVLGSLVLLLGFDDRLGGSLSVVAALALGAYLARDLVAPVRLAADRDGLTVIAGFAGRQRLAWSQVERMRLDRRRHLGLRNEFLEIDTGDDLHLFSSYDVGVPTQQALRTLESLRQAGATPATRPSSPP